MCQMFVDILDTRVGILIWGVQTLVVVSWLWTVQARKEWFFSSEAALHSVRSILQQSAPLMLTIGLTHETARIPSVLRCEIHHSYHYFSLQICMNFDKCAVIRLGRAVCQWRLSSRQWRHNCPKSDCWVTMYGNNVVKCLDKLGLLVGSWLAIVRKHVHSKCKCAVAICEVCWPMEPKKHSIKEGEQCLFSPKLE